MRHQPVRDGLEAYLAGNPDAAFLSHLAECGACREEVGLIEEQRLLIQALRVPADLDLEPQAGFYARVLERIDAQKGTSIWSAFLEPMFARRVVYASAVLTVLLGVLLFTSPKDEMVAPVQILAQEELLPPAPEMVDLEQDRNTVLVQLTSFQE